MPLPKPRSKEKKSAFVSRCISEIAEEYKDNKQRVAICYSQFDEAKKSKASIVGELDGDEFLIFDEKTSNAEEMENESPQEELMETKKDLYEMAVASIASIKSHSDNILNSLNDPKVQENLTETWMQGKLAVAEDYLVSVHNYVMFNK